MNIKAKIILYRIIAIFLLVFSFPLLLIFYLLVKLSSKGPFLFKQLRSGKDKKPFTMYKIRTMVENAETLKTRYQKLNEADGPAFKIRNDPRYTPIGKLLSHTGLDELPQLINVIMGDMSFVGPRPLPIKEAEHIPKKYDKRFSVLPGITSLWVVNGAHKLNFNEWMQLDLSYVDEQTIRKDLIIALKTIRIIVVLALKKLKKRN